MSEDLSDAAMRVFMTGYARERGTGSPPRRQALAAAKAEAYSPGEAVWACADGRGFIEALMIDDEAIRANSVEELEDLISDALIDASTAGQAAGAEVLAAGRSNTLSTGLKSRNGKRISGT